MAMRSLFARFPARSAPMRTASASFRRRFSKGVSVKDIKDSMIDNEGASALLQPTKLSSYPSVDSNFEEALLPGDRSRRAFTYFVLGSSKFLTASAVRLAIIKVVAGVSASADVLALATLELELGDIAEGKTSLVKWRGKPVFVRHRTPEEIASGRAVKLDELKDPADDAARTPVDPKWVVVLGICTHLGCVPLANQGSFEGWFCPCHGSHYDNAGRIRKGPAPLNLTVPPYKIDGDKMIIG